MLTRLTSLLSQCLMMCAWLAGANAQLIDVPISNCLRSGINKMCALHGCLPYMRQATAFVRCAAVLVTSAEALVLQLCAHAVQFTSAEHTRGASLPASGLRQPQAPGLCGCPGCPSDAQEQRMVSLWLRLHALSVEPFYMLSLALQSKATSATHHTHHSCARELKLMIGCISIVSSLNMQ